MVLATLDDQIKEVDNNEFREVKSNGQLMEFGNFGI